ncbi:MAG TPA: NUDIX domain-containing protein [Pseudomonas sabulinigri]|uniref:Nudix hydrolase domain-containing protein n=1 Tax=marine sediment metagenome TaxID=412755 RepID=A0A0F9XRW4_9ZZZZ|nr:NUDIX domain-containing protein [Halopseudomonas sabulinigri]HEC51306.1 NUDIX domain-containing protein [Halopseudomonas sabulinigri]
MKFCSECGQTVTARIPSGDTRSRFICDHCETIHYQNPRIVAGVLATHKRHVLLCRRAIEPRIGYWTLPAGYMENGETTEEAALRETWEEARASMQEQELYMLFNLPHINQVYMFFRGELADLDFSAGEESLEVKLFSEEEIPWTELAFPTVGKTLKQYFIDRQSNHFPVRIRDIVYRPEPAR